MLRGPCRLPILLTLGLAPATAWAAPIELVEQRDQFMLFDDVDGSVQNGNFFLRDPFLAAYRAIEEGFLAVHPDDSQFIVVYTTWSLPQGVGALYQAVANDVQGIGYEHIAPLDPVIPEPYFDDTPDSQVQGFLHMNRWTQYVGDDPGGVDDTMISLIFGQELGHAWLSFVHVDAPDVPSDILLGRSDAHWSFYLHTAGSPVEGHDWVDNGDGTFTAIKHDVFTFSDLDLYLMGLIPPEEVEPFFVITDPHDCIDSALPNGECAPASGHQFQADSYTVSGTRVDLTIEDVIASEGPRVPAWPDAPDTYDVSFLLIKRPDETLDEGELERVDAIIERSIEIFDAQTRGLAHVVNRTAAGGGGEDGDSGGTTEGETGATTEQGDGSTTGSTATDDGLDGTQGPDTEGASSGTGGESTEDAGCGCTSDPRRGAAWALVALVAATRRRRCAA